LGAILTKVFGNQMTQAFRNLAYNIKMSLGPGVLAEQESKLKTMTQLAE
jgi:hypothetical protein